MEIFHTYVVVPFNRYFNILTCVLKAKGYVVTEQNVKSN